MARLKSAARTKPTTRATQAGVGLTLALLVTVFAPRLNQAPSSQHGTVWPGTVRRGLMVRQVRGSGTLLSDEAGSTGASTAGSANARLKAVLHIPPDRAGDIAIGQAVSIDTRNGIVPGRVARIGAAPADGAVTVDVTLTGALPQRVRPGLTVDGIVELERLPDVVHVGRPAFGQENSTITIFKMSPGCDLTQTSCDAVRQRVRLGRSSINSIEILEGLEPGDKVVLSDMSAWEGRDHIRLDRLR